MNEEDKGFSIRHLPGTCCPDYDCLYVRWNKKTCSACDADCTKCKRQK